MKKIKEPTLLPLFVSASSADQVLQRLKAGSLTIGFANQSIPSNEFKRLLKDIGVNTSRISSLEKEVLNILTFDCPTNILFFGQFASSVDLGEKLDFIKNDFEGFRKMVLDLASSYKAKMDKKKSEINEKRPSINSYGLVKSGGSEYYCVINEFVDRGEWATVQINFTGRFSLKVDTIKPFFRVTPIIRKDGTGMAENSLMRKVEALRVKEVTEQEILLAFLSRLHALVQA
jgi:hypothetical protein